MLYTFKFFAMALANFCSLSSFGIFFLFPLFIVEHGGNQVDTGIIMGSFGLSSVLCRPWISEMIDRIGRKRSYTLGSLIMSTFPLAYLSLQGELSNFYLVLLLIRIVHGVGFAICITAAFTYVTDFIPKERLNEGIGMFGVSGLTGTALGPAMAEWIIHQFGFQALFLVASGVAMLGFAAHLRLPETYVHRPGRRSKPFFQVLRKPRVGTAALLAFLFGFGIAASNNFIAPFAKERSVAFLSLYYLAYSAAAIMTRFWGGRMADRFGESRIIPAALFLTGAGLAIVSLLKESILLVMSGLMTGCGHGFLYPSLNALAVRNEPAEVRGKVTGIYTGSIDAGAFAGSVALGYVGALAGFPALFFIAGLSLFLGIPVFQFRNGGTAIERRSPD